MLKSTDKTEGNQYDDDDDDDDKFQVRHPVALIQTQVSVKCSQTQHKTFYIV